MVVTRKDLPIGVQALQCGHALADFTLEHRKTSLEWHKSNYLIFLSSKDEESLKLLIRKLEINDLTFKEFREPDLNNEITAVAIEPSEKTKKLTSSFPLLGKKIK